MVTSRKKSWYVCAMHESEYGGNPMIVGIKDAAKLTGILVISFCAVLVCTMFLNFYMDILNIRDEITVPQVMLFYDAQVSTAKMVSGLSGGCLLAASVVMLFFYIKHYIDTHKKELGILKALGYSNLKIAGSFRIFGFSVLTGTMLGFGGAFLLMPAFYELQNKDKILPEITIHFHPSLFLFLVILPAVGFAFLAVCYAFFKLKMPVLALLKESPQNSYRHTKSTSKVRPASFAGADAESSFIQDLKKATLRSRKSLVFFIVFASFCFSSMTQMSFGMKELSSAMMGAMIMVIGIVLAFTTLFIAITTVINGSRKTIAMMRVFGYSQRQCCSALLGGYRPLGYIGFAIGTIYQYALLRFAVLVVFRDIPGVPEYHFDVPALCISLLSYVIVYEAVMYCYSARIRKISLKEIMLE